MTVQNRYLVSSVSTTGSNVGILGGNTVAMIGGSLCNKTGNTVSVSLWVDPPTGANTYILNNFPVLGNNTLTVFGADVKHFLINGDSLYISSNTASAIDFILSTVEGV